MKPKMSSVEFLVQPEWKSTDLLQKNVIMRKQHQGGAYQGPFIA